MVSPDCELSTKQIMFKLSSKAYNSQQLLSGCTISTLFRCEDETTMRDNTFFAILNLDYSSIRRIVSSI